jgi:hypothetical protein
MWGDTTAHWTFRAVPGSRGRPDFNNAPPQHDGQTAVRYPDSEVSKFSVGPRHVPVHRAKLEYMRRAKEHNDRLLTGTPRAPGTTGFIALVDVVCLGMHGIMRPG